MTNIITFISHKMSALKTNDYRLLFVPSAGIIRIRFKGMISARSIKAPHFDKTKIRSFG